MVPCTFKSSLNSNKITLHNFFQFAFQKERTSLKFRDESKFLHCALSLLPIHDPSSDLASIISSNSNCGSSMALNPKTVPMLRDASPDTMQAAIY